MKKYKKKWEDLSEVSKNSYKPQQKASESQVVLSEFCYFSCDKPV